jgi:hypothetical protein
MRDIKDARRASDLMMLLDLGAVVNRHIPTAKIHHASAELEM